MRIAFLSALKEEQVVVRRAWPMSPSGSLQGFPLETGERAISLCSGVGAERMAHAVSVAQKVFAPQLFVLLGFSAGLRGDLPVGEVICDDRGEAGLVSALRGFPIPLRFGQTTTCGFLNTAEEKVAFAVERPEAMVADLESEAFMQACEETPYLVLRVVSDELHTDLPLDFEPFLDARGFPKDSAIAREALRRPSLVPKLIGLAKDASLAQGSLGKVLTDVRPLLVRRLLELS